MKLINRLGIKMSWIEKMAEYAHINKKVREYLFGT